MMVTVQWKVNGDAKKRGLRNECRQLEASAAIELLARRNRDGDR